MNRDGINRSATPSSASVPLLAEQHGAAAVANTRGSVFGERTAVTISWQDLVYEVDLPKEKTTRRILSGVSGYVSAGQVLAILGPSGAGKTTMLDILACRQKGGRLSGAFLMNGHPVVEGIFRRVSAYVQQEDILHSYLSVRETITYAAKLRLPKSYSAADIDHRVLQVMQSLGIDHIANSKIGSEIVRGISGGEKKRTAIAVELVTSPSLIYLDEPTTGLDTFTALHLMYLLKKLAQQGTTVVLSIHQPRSSIFRLFDKVLVLNGYGEEAYFGPAESAVQFLTSVGVKNTFPDNPADFLLDSVAVVRSAEKLEASDFPFLPPPTQAKDIAAAFRSILLDDINRQIDGISRAYADDSRLPDALTSPYHRPVWTQIYVVAARAFINKMRDPIATVVAVIVSIFFAVLVGSLYFHIGLTQSGINNRLGVLFFLTMNTAFSNLGSLAIFLFDRSIYTREHRNGMYRPSAYYLGKIAQDMPFAILVTLIFDAIAYYMVGLQPEAAKFGWFFLINVLVMMNSYAVCMLFSNLAKNLQVANLAAPLVLVLYLLPSGFLIKLSSLPVYWRWLEYISFFRFGFESLVINEFSGLTFTCSNTSKALDTCCTDGIECVNAELGFSTGSFYSNVVYTATSVGVYLFLGYLALRILRSGEGK